MNLIEIFSILIIHWIADFWLQSDKMAKGKGKNWKDLISHTGLYTITFFIGGAFLLNDARVVIFCLITFILHTITDYFTSRLNSKLYKEGNNHGFFIAIGGDQILHYVQLFLTYYWLFKI